MPDIHELGNILRTRRLDAQPRLTQGDIEQALRREGVPSASQSMISRLEKGRASLLDSWPAPEHRFRVLKAYGLSDIEISKLSVTYHLGVEHILMGAQTVHPPIESRLIDCVGDISAGNGSSAVLEAKDRIIAPEWIARDYDLESVFVVSVTGNSMTSEDASKTIPEGAIVFFHKPTPQMQPRPGDIVCVYLTDHGVNVIKVFEPALDYSVLASYNKEVPPIVLSENNPGILQGIYLGHTVKGPRARR